MGHQVHALNCQGYKARGIDFAEKTVHRVKEAVPELDIRVGDVRNLPIETNGLDGYVSIGVIEHFWEGYEAILSEMARTLKTKGFLFLDFPYMSPLRRFKVRQGKYSVGTIKQFEEYEENNSKYAIVSILFELTNATEKEMIWSKLLSKKVLISGADIDGIVRAMSEATQQVFDELVVEIGAITN